jgi:translation initiation factor IF-1
MVKNTQGGSKHKGLARKIVNASANNHNIRLPQEDGECFARVISMLGNGMCSVKILQNNGTLLDNAVCQIRGKFRGKHKSQNIVSRDAFILVGMRELSGGAACDLLEIYHESSLPFILSYSHLTHLLLSNPISNHNSSDDISFVNHPLPSIPIPSYNPSIPIPSSFDHFDDI